MTERELGSRTLPINIQVDEDVDGKILVWFLGDNPLVESVKGDTPFEALGKFVLQYYKRLNLKIKVNKCWTADNFR